MEPLPQETKLMFSRRRQVYINALKSQESEENAIKYANIWANIEYLQCRYNRELTEKAREYGRGA